MNRIAAWLFAALLGAVPAAAQEAYPGKPITLVVPYAPGGGSDFLGRTLAEGLHARLNQTVIVQNIPGAGSVVGSQQVAKARPDGYTLLLNHVGLSTVPALYKKLNFDPLASYEFVGLFAEAPMMIIARKEFAPRNFAELVAYARQHPGKLTNASSGNGTAVPACRGKSTKNRVMRMGRDRAGGIIANDCLYNPRLWRSPVTASSGSSARAGGSLSPSAPWSGRTPSARWAWRCADAAAEGPGIMRVCAWWRSAGSAPLTP